MNHSTSQHIGSVALDPDPADLKLFIQASIDSGDEKRSLYVRHLRLYRTDSSH
jgi:hypothetical protein